VKVEEALEVVTRIGELTEDARCVVTTLGAKVDQDGSVEEDCCWQMKR